MTTFIVPPLERTPWPTLGPGVCDFIEDLLVFGPGDLHGQPAKLDDEWRAILYRAYEVYPKDHPQAGRRRFKRVGISKRKGTAKTEFAAWVAAVELHPEGPVRCDGWRKEGKTWVPVGAPVRDPYIPMVAYTEEQTNDLAYGALYDILRESPLADDFDIGLGRIMRLDGHGECRPMANAPSARDGARTTHQHFDETHRLTLPNQKRAHVTMLQNIPKRKLADAWSLETTTAYGPGEGSVAEGTHDYARKVAAGEIKDTRLFFFHRGASDKWDISDREQLREAIEEASGPAAPWSDIESIVAQWDDPTLDQIYLERVWLNRIKQPQQRAFDVEQWKDLAKPDYTIEPASDIAPGAICVAGFDGSKFWDSTGIILTEVVTGHQVKLGLWERPVEAEQWEVDEDDVNEVVAGMFATYRIWRFYCDPAKWESRVAEWASIYGHDRVIAWWTNRWTAVSRAVRAYREAMRSGEVSHDGDADFTRHIGNAHRRNLNIVDEDGAKAWVIQKARPDSPDKIDLAMAGTLSWQARIDAMAAGVLAPVEWTAA